MALLHVKTCLRSRPWCCNALVPVLSFAKTCMWNMVKSDHSVLLVKKMLLPPVLGLPKTVNQSHWLKIYRCWSIAWFEASPSFVCCIQGVTTLGSVCDSKCCSKMIFSYKGEFLYDELSQQDTIVLFVLFTDGQPRPERDDPSALYRAQIFSTLQ